MSFQEHTLYPREDCFDVVDGAIKGQFPGRIKDSADFAVWREEWDDVDCNKLSCFELGAEKSEAKWVN